ncbi:hypothetical protein V5799_000750, partial [Amblyomma americanum]
MNPVVDIDVGLTHLQEKTQKKYGLHQLTFSDIFTGAPPTFAVSPKIKPGPVAATPGSPDAKAKARKPKQPGTPKKEDYLRTVHVHTHTSLPEILSFLLTCDIFFAVAWRSAAASTAGGKKEASEKKPSGVPDAASKEQLSSEQKAKAEAEAKAAKDREFEELLKLKMAQKEARQK